MDAPKRGVFFVSLAKEGTAAEGGDGGIPCRQDVS